VWSIRFVPDWVATIERIRRRRRTGRADGARREIRLTWSAQRTGVEANTY